MVKLDYVNTISTSAIVEVNYNFDLQQHPQAASWAALFDQWCIPQVSMTWRSQMPPGSTGSESILYTALDFDSIGALGSISAIEDYSSCQLTAMTPGRTVTRSIRPCLKVSTQQIGAGNVNSTLVRTWQDSGATSASWNGLRSIYGTASVAYNVTATLLIWYGFRNPI